MGRSGTGKLAPMRRWVEELQRALTSGPDLAGEGLIDASEVDDAEAVRSAFEVRIPPAYLSRLAGRDPEDPIWRSVVPTPAELDTRPEERADPIGDAAHTPVAGITHRYPDRALLKPTHTCAVYCRFCFRRETVGDAERTLKRSDLEAALAYIERTESLWEVILTGGDPLVLSDERLAGIVERLRGLDHVRVLRFHTRVPLVLPARVTDELLEILAPAGRRAKPAYVVTHINHVHELGPEAEEALARLADRGVPLLNQSVLLKGVNDTPEAMEALLRRLVELRIRPYYLHHGDLARGTGHFRTTLTAGQELVRALRGRLSGIALPRYVLDIPGGYGKVPVGPRYLTPDGPDAYRVEDPEGRTHRYPPLSSDDGDGEDG